MTVAGIKTPCPSPLESTVKLLIPLTLAVQPAPRLRANLFVYVPFSSLPRPITCSFNRPASPQGPLKFNPILSSDKTMTRLFPRRKTEPKTE